MKHWWNVLIAATAAMILSSAAHAADVYSPRTTAAPTYNEPVIAKDWTGIYAGFLIGWSTADFGVETDTSVFWNDTSYPFNFGSSDDAVNFGAQLGGDYQYGMVVVGAVADFSFLGIEGSDRITLVEGDDGGLFHDNEFSIDWLGTARLRGGVLLTPEILVYATGGIAFAQVDTASRFRIEGDFDEVEGADGFDLLRASNSDNRWGYTVGAGVEAKITQNIRVKAEYLYVDLGEAEYNVNLLEGGIDHSGNTEIDLHILRAGLAYQF